MPTYAYACTQCEHHFEVRQSFTDDALTDCPECSGRLRKLFDAVGVVFKGSGFYRTDSRSNGSGNGSGSGASGAGKSGTPASSNSGSAAASSSGSSSGSTTSTSPSSGS